MEVGILVVPFRLTFMPGSGTTKDENHPHPSLPHRGGGIKGEGAFSYKPGKDIFCSETPEQRFRKAALIFRIP